MIDIIEYLLAHGYNHVNNTRNVREILRLSKEDMGEPLVAKQPRFSIKIEPRFIVNEKGEIICKLS